MKTLTPIKALLELAELPGYSKLTARNVLLEATKNPYIITNDGTVFVAAARDDDGETVFLIADVQQTACSCGEHQETDGAAFAALLNEAKAAGAERVGTRSLLPGWC